MTIQEKREKLNLTQTELAEKSGLSLRTIQRVEAGQIPKGYTLTALAKALDLTAEDLKGEVPEHVKWINLSVLLGFIIPYGNIIAPAILTYRTCGDKTMAKDILSFQVVYTIILSLMMIAAPFFVSSLGLNSKYIIVIFIIGMLLNAIVVFLNALSLSKVGKLRIKLSFKVL